MAAARYPFTETQATMIRQIGARTLLAISGGRVVLIDEDTVSLPVRYGYRVEVHLDHGSDTYTVRRVLERGGKMWVKGEQTHIYDDQLGDAAYRASCYRDRF